MIWKKISGIAKCWNPYLSIFPRRLWRCGKYKYLTCVYANTFFFLLWERTTFPLLLRFEYNSVSYLYWNFNFSSSLSNQIALFLLSAINSPFSIICLRSNTRECQCFTNFMWPVFENLVNEIINSRSMAV